MRADQGDAVTDHADTIRRDYGADLPDAAHLLVSVLEWGGVEELLGADLHGRAHEAVGTILAEREQAIDERDKLRARVTEVGGTSLIDALDENDRLRAERQKAIDALREQDQLRAEMEQKLNRLRDLFRPEPYHGLRLKILCSRCHGQGEVNGRNSDDPRWVPCPTCKGDGLAEPARAALHRLGEQP